MNFNVQRSTFNHFGRLHGYAEDAAIVFKIMREGIARQSTCRFVLVGVVATLILRNRNQAL